MAAQAKPAPDFSWQLPVWSGLPVWGLGNSSLARLGKKKMFFSEEKNQKTFVFCAGSKIRERAGEGSYVAGAGLASAVKPNSYAMGNFNDMTWP